MAFLYPVGKIGPFAIGIQWQFCIHLNRKCDLRFLHGSRAESKNRPLGSEVFLRAAPWFDRLGGSECGYAAGSLPEGFYLPTSPDYGVRVPVHLRC